MGERSWLSWRLRGSKGSFQGSAQEGADKEWCRWEEQLRGNWDIRGIQCSRGSQGSQGNQDSHDFQDIRENLK